MIDSPRAQQVFLAVLPASVRDGSSLLAGLRIVWAGEGNLGDVRQFLSQQPDIVTAHHLSPGARQALAEAGISWADETGAAEVAIGTILVSRTGRPLPPRNPAIRWAPATLAVAEGLLCGVEATVAATREATGLSTGSCTTALQTLTTMGLLEAEVARGRGAGRRLRDASALLSAYATAAVELRSPLFLQVRVTWRDPVAGLLELSRRLNCYTTGAVAAAVMAPHLTHIGASEVYLEVETLAGLQAMAEQAGLKPIEGGRLTLRPMPTRTISRLAQSVGGLRVAPWPRVYVDLRSVGVRGEEAAEHLREVCCGS